jgi:uncharacterized membrane protein HdeD (DUF308 family)
MAIETVERTRETVRKEGPVREPSRWLIALGAATIVLGCLAIGMSAASTLLSVLVLGVLCVAGCIFQGVFALTAERWSGFGLHLLMAVLYGITGAYLIVNPLTGAAALTLALGFLFAFSGFFRIAAGAAIDLPGKGWTIFSGVVTAALGVYVLYNAAGLSLFLLGTLLGVDLLLIGIDLTAVGMAMRRNPIERLIS